MLVPTTASLCGTTRRIAGQWWVYMLKCGSDQPNAGHLRAMNSAHVLQSSLVHIWHLFFVTS